jgi:predicted nucleic acid-binding protein
MDGSTTAAAERGIIIRSTIDCLVAQLAAENSALLLSKDRVMAQILNSGIIKVKSI